MLAAIYDIAIAGDVRVANISLGGVLERNDETGCQSQAAADRAAARFARDKPMFRTLFEGAASDVLWTIAAGNSCAPGAASPWGLNADLPNVVTVAATNSNGELASFSNFGAGVEVAAPGGISVAEKTEGLMSSSASTGSSVCLPSERCALYRAHAGTSMAAPVVAGVGALVGAADPGRSAAEIGDCITSTAGRDGTGAVSLRDDLPASRRPAIAFSGADIPIVNAAAAVECAPPPPDDGGPGPGSSDLTLVRDMSPYWGWEAPDQLTAVGDRLFFAAGTTVSGRRELWRSDGDAAGTVQLTDRGADRGAVYALTRAGSRVFFSARTSSGSIALWASDGTVAGTSALKSFDAFAGKSVTEVSAVGERAYFLLDEQGGSSELWTTDGTTAGTQLVKALPAGAVELTAVDARLFLVVAGIDYPNELWTSDGTADGTSLVAQIGASDLQPALGGLVFTSGDAEHGPELWTSDGTALGTRMLVDRVPGPGAGVHAQAPPLVEWDGAVWYGFTRGCSPCKPDLVRSDGTPSGTSLVGDAGVSVSGVAPVDGAMVGLGSRLLFSGEFSTEWRTFSDDYELWATDGTAAGVHRVKDLVPGRTGASPSLLTRFGDIVVFKTSGNGEEEKLWRTDGTGAGTVEIPTPVAEGEWFGTQALAVAGERLFIVSGGGLWSYGPSPSP